MMEKVKACPSLDTMRAYAEAAMNAGWRAAVDAAVGRTLNCAWEREWFEKNPPESAIPECEWSPPASSLSARAKAFAERMDAGEMAGHEIALRDLLLEVAESGSLLSDETRTLEALLRVTVPVPAGCVAPEGTPMSPEFRVSVQHVRDDGVHFIIHAHGHNSDTLDLIAKGNTLTPYVCAQPGASNE